MRFRLLIEVFGKIFLFLFCSYLAADEINQSSPGKEDVDRVQLLMSTPPEKAVMMVPIDGKPSAIMFARGGITLANNYAGLIVHSADNKTPKTLWIKSADGTPGSGHALQCKVPRADQADIAKKLLYQGLEQSEKLDKLIDKVVSESLFSVVCQAENLNIDNSLLVISARNEDVVPMFIMDESPIEVSYVTKVAGNIVGMFALKAGSLEQ